VGKSNEKKINPGELSVGEEGAYIRTKFRPDIIGANPSVVNKRTLIMNTVNCLTGSPKGQIKANK